ncbi:protein kinase C-binding protein 1 isoform X1 [Frankliniella occidentalis]|uniref:Protein kinase C-binding protein 1 isoform X1 n=1 Tax=Frankliniella occidentalis TaxID=133901 RepID=A0A6J1S3H3_FRAOC|nr:protein kinase C-binding protein 1 isoform X1 [Frankliniella occidentalis]XP_026273332.1 protein kinase C-binding protein 1 isoform X1 [Frankliniella occidentalis]XP_052121285.1 protein kinase C-binding protein 1 isoform X1 [Frankliniella occidentalis]
MEAIEQEVFTEERVIEEPLTLQDPDIPLIKPEDQCEPANTDGTVTCKDAENPSSAPILLSAVIAPEVDPENVLRSPPKLVPAVVAPKRKSDESIHKLIKPLTGSMKNTPASLSIIDAPSSTLNKSTRSTRSSIDPTFAAKQRSFLNKVHNALSSQPLDDTSCESDQEIVADDDVQNDTSPLYIPGLEGIQPRRLSGLQNSGSKRRREDSPAQKVKIPLALNNDHSHISPASVKDTIEPLLKKKALVLDGKDSLSDIFCWLCHREDPDLSCATCPRAFHGHCLRRPVSNNCDSEWMCPECVTILRAENQETRSKALKMLTLDQLCNLLLFAVERMKYCSGANVFESPVDPEEFPTYHDYIVNPMYLALLEKNIKRKMYGSTEAFVADASWIVHNCIVFNSVNSKLTSIAKNILRVCKQEMSEIENCPDCYNYAYTADENWFIQVCQKPHVLVWAKLKGFPYWPAKAMRCNSDAIDVRFFGAHDRAWVPAKDCYLYSQENPNPNAPSKIQPTQASLKKKNPKNNLDVCIEELELHIQLLKERFSTFQYSPLKSPVLPRNLESHLKFMLPEYKPNESKSAAPSKLSPLKRHNFEVLKTSVSSEPLIKRMKADSSSPQISLGKTFKSAKEKDQVPSDTVVKPECKETGVLSSKPAPVAAHENSTITTSDSTTSNSEENVKVPKQNCTSNLQTPASRTSIAELRLKKKDARKIGLVDRLQEKIALWVARSDQDITKVTSKEKSDDNFQPEDPEGDEDTEDDKAKETHGYPSSSGDKTDDKTAKQTVLSDESSKSEVNSIKIDITAAAKPVNEFLQSFNLTNQPKVILKKLILPKPKAEANSNLPDDGTVIKTENVSDEEVDQNSQNHFSQLNKNVKKVIVSELKLIRDEENSKDETELPNPTTQEKKLKSQTTECVTSTTNTAPSSVHVKKLSNLSTNKVIAEALSDHAKSGTLDKAQNNSDVPAVPTTQSSVLDATSCKEEPESDPESKIGTNTATPDKNPGENSNIAQITVTKSEEVKPKRKSTTQRKTARKTIVVSNPAANPSVKKTASSKKSKLASTKSFSSLKAAISDSDESSVLTVADNENSSQLNNDTDNQLSALKSLLSKNVTVCLENPAKNDIQQVVLNTDKVKTLCENSVTPHVVSLSLPNSKAKTIVIQSGSTKRLQESPPKIITSFSATTPAQRLAHGATSILKVVKATSPGEIKSINVSGDSEQVLKQPARRTYVVQGNIAISKPQNSSPSPVKSTFVTVSQSPTGVPFVRRILPRAIPLAPPLSTPVSGAGAGSILASNKTDSSSTPENVAKLTQRISVRSLPTLVTSSPTPALSSKAVTPLEQSNLTPEDRSILKKSPQITVGAPKESKIEIPAKSSSNLREMPPLSIASVCSLQPPSVQAISGSSAQTQTSSSRNNSKVFAGVGPLSSELQSQASKMTDVFMSCLKDCLSDMGNKGSLEAQIRCLQLDIEHMQWQHQQEIEELRHNTELVISEVKDRMKVESQLAVNTALANARKEKDAAIEATKEKQWCAFCKKEAMFYCCWNTSYCDYRCQQNHWPSHSLTCTQNASSVDAERQSSLENGQSGRRIVIRRKEVLSPPLLKKC